MFADVTQLSAGSAQTAFGAVKPVPAGDLLIAGSVCKVGGRGGKREADIKKEKNEHKRKRMKLADPEIKHGYCTEPDTIAAFTYLLFDHYCERKPSLQNEQLHEEMQAVTATEDSAGIIINKWFMFDENSNVYDDTALSTKENTSDPDDMDRQAMWTELRTIGIKTKVKLRSEILSKLDGVTVEGLPVDARHPKTKSKGLKGVRFMNMAAQQERHDAALDAADGQAMGPPSSDGGDPWGNLMAVL